MNERSNTVDPVALLRESERELRDGDPVRAVELAAEAIATRPDLDRAWCGLGDALAALGEWPRAEDAYRRAREQDPHDATAALGLARACAALRKLTEAVANLEEAVRLAPEEAEAHRLLGLTLAALERSAEAIDPLGRALSLEPGDAVARNQLGLALLCGGRIEEGALELRRAVELEPENAAFQRDAASACVQTADVAGAREAASKAIALDPEDAQAHVSLGWTFEVGGDMGRAAELYHAAIAADPTSSTAYYRLARAKLFDDDEVLRDLLERDGLDRVQRCDLLFALGEIHDRRGEYDVAFRRYAEANRAMGIAYDPDERTRTVESAIRTATPELLARGRDIGHPTDEPVFVLGMPRSGTSLVEEILAAHPAVHAMGEYAGVADLALNLPDRAGVGAGFPEGLADLGPEGVRRMVERYFACADRPKTPAIRVTDKSPGNFLFLGLIALVFPNARVIHCQRDPRDTCLSNFFTNFGSRRCSFSYDLEHLARYYEDYERLMAHWRETLPLRTVEVRYEELVADAEAGARRLVAFCGLPWDPACLSFHESKRVVLTASATQVREPVHTRSCERWRRYERHLGPLARLA